MDFLHWILLFTSLVFAGLAQWYKVSADRNEEWVHFIVSEIERLIEEDTKSEA